MKNFRVDIYTYPRKVKKAIKKLTRAGMIINSLYELYKQEDNKIYQYGHSSEDTIKIHELLDNIINLSKYFSEKTKDNQIL